MATDVWLSVYCVSGAASLTLKLYGQSDALGILFHNIRPVLLHKCVCR